MKNPSLIPLFEDLKKLLKPFEGRYLVDKETEDWYGLTGNTKYTVTSKKSNNVLEKENAEFAAIIIQKSYVGLYLMAPYVELEHFKHLKVLLPHLKGKSCFHIRRLTPELIKEVKEALNISHELYVKWNLVE
jgi:hypothetical protein